MSTRQIWLEQGQIQQVTHNAMIGAFLS